MTNAMSSTVGSLCW